MNTSSPRRRTAAAVLVTAITAGSLAGALSAVALTNALPGASTPHGASTGATTVSYDTTDLEKTLTHVAATASPAVVQVLATISSAGPFGGTAESSGSGFVVSADGTVVTSLHVVNGASAIEVVLADTTRLSASVLTTDTTNDLAVLHVTGQDLPALALAPSGAEIGQTVVAIGTPLGEFPNSVTVGVVSGTDRSVDVGSARSSQHLTGVFQTDAALSSGMSGGPILNLAGQVVGVTTAVSASAQGVGFAEPASSVAAMLTRI